MKKKFLILGLALSMCLFSTACSSDTAKEAKINATDESSTETSSKKTENKTENSAEKNTEEATKEQQTEAEKQYDVYVNGKGFDKGATVSFKVNLKANDKELVQCCPSVNIACEGVTDPEVIESFVEYNETDTNPLLISNTGDSKYKDEYYLFWGYYDLLDRWNNPDAPPLDITEGIHVFTAEITFSEAGNYTVTVTSGNGYEEMAEEFAKYDNCFSLEMVE